VRTVAAYQRARFDDSERLAAVVAKTPPFKDLWLIVNTACIPRELGEGGYVIGLGQVDTPAKALDWTFHVREKPQWTAHGWVASTTRRQSSFMRST
jgi:hypothetical protein